MPVRVVDASAIAALVFGEPDADDVARRIEGASLAAPMLMPFELANTCVRKIRTYPHERTALIEAYALWPRLGIALRQVDDIAVVLLAGERSLTAYDASYLWLARDLACDLVTLDRRLARAYRVSPGTP